MTKLKVGDSVRYTGLSYRDEFCGKIFTVLKVRDRYELGAPLIKGLEAHGFWKPDVWQKVNIKLENK